MPLQNDLHQRLRKVTTVDGVEVIVKEITLATPLEVDITDITTTDTLDVKIQDQTTAIVDYFLCRDLLTLTLSTDAVIDEYTITVTDATGVVVGTYVCLQEGERAFQAKILSIATNTLTLDTPLDFSFTTAASVANRNPQLNIDGSSTVQIASLFPIAGAKWDITRIIMSMTHAAAADDGKFGGISALTSGIVIRKSDGIHHTIFNAKTNGDLRERMFDVTFSDKAPAGQYGTSGRRSFSGQDKNGVVIRLDGDLNEKLEVLIQDDLEGLTSFRIVAQGHVVED
jgi:hypothetical protein